MRAKNLDEIEEQFETELQNAKISFKEPDFQTYPDKEMIGADKSKAQNKWNGIWDSYNNAKKNNLLNPRHDKIKEIIRKLMELQIFHQDSASIKRNLAYCHTLAENWEVALGHYQNLAISSQNEIDWYNFAVVAQENGEEALACYSLSQVFHRLPISDDREAWYLYVRLLLKFKNYKELSQLCQHSTISQDQTSLLLKTAAYLFKIAGQENQAEEALSKSMEEKVSVSDIQEVLKDLDQQPEEGYQRVAEEISRLMDQHPTDQTPQGSIHQYGSKYGFLRDAQGNQYRFDFEEVLDSDLRGQMTQELAGQHIRHVNIPVDFEVEQESGKAIKISNPNATANDWGKFADSAMAARMYERAIKCLEQVISIDEGFPYAQEKLKQCWLQYAEGAVKGAYYHDAINRMNTAIERMKKITDIDSTHHKEKLEEWRNIERLQDITFYEPVRYYYSQANIEVEIVVEHSRGHRLPEKLELVVEKNSESFTLTESQIKSKGSLFGATLYYFTVPLELTEAALQRNRFTLRVRGRYFLPTGARKTASKNLEINLYDKFKKISNPYNEGAPVEDTKMFYGREQLIDDIVDSMNRCVVIYGQKRSGKTSILHQLKQPLKKQNFMILDLGGITQYVDKDSFALDEDSSTSFVYKILQGILMSFEEAIEDRIDDGASSLEISFPSATDFFAHPAPMNLFTEVFRKYSRCAAKQQDWRDVQPVLFIDEFSSVYQFILDGDIPESFMKNWKGWIEKNYFNVVIVGQDVMKQFMEAFSNEFAIAQKERVTYLDEEDASALIDKPIFIEQIESRYPERRVIKRIIELTAGNPYYIQMFCNRLVRHMNRDQHRAKYVTYSYVEHVKDKLISDLGLESGFNNLYNSGEVNRNKDEDVLKILEAIAVNSRTGPCKGSDINCKTASSIDNLLDELVNRDVIDQEDGGRYSIKVGLFKEWLLINPEPWRLLQH